MVNKSEMLKSRVSVMLWWNFSSLGFHLMFGRCHCVVVLKEFNGRT